MTDLSPVLAPRLRAGDRIGVVSPSGVVTPALRGQLDRGVRVLVELGFRVVLGRHALTASLGYTATPEEKAEDLNAMFADPDIRAVVCSQGGATANACLPLLDYARIRADPRILLGISDITTLLCAVHARTGLVTFHGDDVMWGLGREVSPYSRAALVGRLVEGRTGAIPPAGPREAIRPGTAEGPLVGGNLTSLLKLAGTPYWPELTGAILFLEEFGFSPEVVFCQLHQLGQLGVLDRIAGILIGHIHGDGAGTPQVRFADVVRTVVGDRPIPVLRVSDFGHNCPNTVLPVGGRARLDADRCELTLVGPCLNGSSCSS